MTRIFLATKRGDKFQEQTIFDAFIKSKRDGESIYEVIEVNGEITESKEVEFFDPEYKDLEI